ncbi:hypothetical protein ABT084_20165 [Streptomyces sp. NPDC002138]|uniref:hypothetical protein n=1 Tax=Streptomyces sp. NPDC002138 TaxID=3154410 RepID=UPI00332AC276
MVGLYRQVWAHSDRTIASLDLDAVSRIPWRRCHPRTRRRDGRVAGRERQHGARRPRVVGGPPGPGGAGRAGGRGAGWGGAAGKRPGEPVTPAPTGR